MRHGRDPSGLLKVPPRPTPPPGAPCHIKLPKRGPCHHVIIQSSVGSASNHAPHHFKLLKHGRRHHVISHQPVISVESAIAARTTLSCSNVGRVTGDRPGSSAHQPVTSQVSQSSGIIILSLITSVANSAPHHFKLLERGRRHRGPFSHQPSASHESSQSVIRHHQSVVSHAPHHFKLLERGRRHRGRG